MLRVEMEMKVRGLSQGKLARMADVSEAGLSRVLRGVEPCGYHRGKAIAKAIQWPGEWEDLFSEVSSDEQ